ncbi:hypothetical protein EsH8_I_000193 [Colletotrichum jinshuiense]
MRSTNLFVIVTTSLAIMISALKAPIEGYDVFIPEWEVQATPGGKNLSFHGTVEHVVDELTQVNPQYAKSFGIDFGSIEKTSHGPLQKRADFSKTPYICHNFDTGLVSAGWEGIDYLRKVPGKPKASAGPASCGQVSCSWNTAIWWCNDDTKPKELGSYADISDGARWIWNRCTDFEFYSYYSSGQAFHADNWNVIIKESDDPC